MRLLRSHFPLPLTIVNCNDEQLGCCRIRFAHSEGPNFQLVYMLDLLLWKISTLNHQSFGICIVSSTILSKYFRHSLVFLELFSDTHNEDRDL